jgi:hypothetical protein
MQIKQVENKETFKLFYKLPKEVYKNNPYYRNTDNDLIKMLCEGKSLFHTHSKIIPFLLYNNEKVCGRFLLIDDFRMLDYVQVAFLEFTEKTELKLIDNIKECAKKTFPQKQKICFGLNGHLNYGLGLLLNNFKRTPLFGLPYSAEYYPKYFDALEKQSIVSFRFEINNIKMANEKLKKYPIDDQIKIRTLDNRNFEEAIGIYNYLNNECFKSHPFWAHRDYAEDMEMFKPLKHLLCDKNLIIAEDRGRPVGFILWFPDFNQLLKHRNSKLKCKYSFSFHSIKYKYFNKIDSIRIAEIGIKEEYHKHFIDLKLIKALIELNTDNRYKYCEGGFIFEENKSSINLLKKYGLRLFDVMPKKNSEFAIYVSDL